MKLNIQTAKEIIQAGFAWGRWTDDQKLAFKMAWEALNQQIDAPNHLLVLQNKYTVQLTSDDENVWTLLLLEKGKEVYKGNHGNLNDVLLQTIEWMQRNIELT
ncbi:hypothetical protein [Bacillus altitudinis]|uniref:hypothetical protein n=1 Tax=Bacillus altitudinis TaxID=293387 RepID=UPI0039BFCE7B